MSQGKHDKALGGVGGGEVNRGYITTCDHGSNFNASVNMLSLILMKGLTLIKEDMNLVDFKWAQFWSQKNAPLHVIMT